MTKRKTKAEIFNEARIAWLAENADHFRASGHDEYWINLIARSVAKHAADEARPTPKQKRERREKEEREAVERNRARARYEEWRANAAAGRPPEIPSTGQIVPPRNVVKDGDTFTAFAVIGDSTRKLFQVPSEMVAQRIADVARYALAIVYGCRTENPLFADELKASAGVAADYALGYRRSPGRPSKLGRKPSGQFTRIKAITSGEVVRKLGDLVGKAAPALRDPDKRDCIRQWPNNPLDYLPSLMIGRQKRGRAGARAPLRTIGPPELRKAGQSPAFATSGSTSQPAASNRRRIRRPQGIESRSAVLAPREQARQEAAARTRRWYTKQRALHRDAGLLTPVVEATLRRCAREYHKRLTGDDPQLRREALDRWAAEQDTPCHPDEPWRHFLNDDWKVDATIGREWEEWEHVQREIELVAEIEKHEKRKTQRERRLRG